MGELLREPIYTLDGDDFKQMVLAALLWLRQHQAMVNALNVFPVPDGDTGTNMTLTMTSAWDEIAGVQEPLIGRMASKMAHGALMGARGNSGVILSQIWRGFARSLDDQLHLRAEDMVAAMHSAAETAYKGVVKPVEGTILTVVREVAEETFAVAQETRDLRVLFERIVQHARASVARTPTLLPVLRQAGVVDSGGQGLLVILEGMCRHLQGLPVAEDGVQELPFEISPLQPAVHGAVTQEQIEFDSNYPYDVQFIIVGHNMNVDEIRAAIEKLGDCPLTVGDASTIKVHVHVADPGIPISYGAKCGSLRDVVVEDMQAQYQEFMSGRESSLTLMGADIPAGLNDAQSLNIGVVVVAAGAGLANVFRSLGTVTVVEGGQTMNPSTAQILEAVENVPADNVIILPNNKNIFLAARQAAEVSQKEVVVVPTRTIPQGVAALLSLDQNASLEANVATMSAVSKEVTTGEITWATRDVELNGIEVREGDAIGLLDGDLVVDTRSFEEAVRWLLAEADLEDRELVTLYYGEGVNPEQAQALTDELIEAYPDLEFEVVEGLQPHYPYIISIE
ncbi:MAG TPA: DAK2 domain-containing protein [Anaerolineae bacterium]|nr:DAK2 domain-containing protein [Anaerolineae bacterium]